MGSMLTATLFGVFFTPLFYVAARRWLSRKKRKNDQDDLDEPPLSARSPSPAPSSAGGEPGGGPHDA
jgi:multidrug efflux pump